MSASLRLGVIIARLESAREELNDDDAEVVFEDESGEFEITGVEVDDGCVFLKSEDV